MKDIQFLSSLYNLKDLPGRKLPELIMAGRSNVGKSSFINSIFNRKGLAKTSSTPGKTRSINYYLVEQRFYLVDLPGYGYAKVSKKEREFWNRFLTSYLLSGLNKPHLFHLIDSRLGPTELDYQLNETVTNANIPFTLLFTKIDKLKQSEKAALKKQISGFYARRKREFGILFLFLKRWLRKKRGDKEDYKSLQIEFY